MGHEERCYSHFVQFNDIVHHAEALANAGKVVIIAALNGDYQQKVGKGRFTIGAALKASMPNLALSKRDHSLRMRRKDREAKCSMPSLRSFGLVHPPNTSK
jgi:hypothetical protein